MAATKKEVPLMVTIPKDLRAQVEEARKLHGQQLKFVVAQALRLWLEKHANVPA